MHKVLSVCTKELLPHSFNLFYSLKSDSRFFVHVKQIWWWNCFTYVEIWLRLPNFPIAFDVILRRRNVVVADRKSKRRFMFDTVRRLTFGIVRRFWVDVAKGSEGRKTGNTFWRGRCRRRRLLVDNINRVVKNLLYQKGK